MCVFFRMCRTLCVCVSESVKLRTSARAGTGQDGTEQGRGGTGRDGAWKVHCVQEGKYRAKGTTRAKGTSVNKNNEDIAQY